MVSPQVEFITTLSADLTSACPRGCSGGILMIMLMILMTWPHSWKKRKKSTDRNLTQKNGKNGLNKPCWALRGFFVDVEIFALFIHISCKISIQGIDTYLMQWMKNGSDKPCWAKWLSPLQSYQPSSTDGERWKITRQNQWNNDSCGKQWRIQCARGGWWWGLDQINH